MPALRGFLAEPLDTAHLPAIVAPTLVLTQPGDALHPLRSGEVLNSLMPAAVLCVAPSRWFWRDHCEDMADLIAAFIEGRDGDAEAAFREFIERSPRGRWLRAAEAHLAAKKGTATGPAKRMAPGSGEVPARIIGFGTVLATGGIPAPLVDATWRDRLPILDECLAELRLPPHSTLRIAIEMDVDAMIPDPTKTIAKGAIRPWATRATRPERLELEDFCARRMIRTDVPWKQLPAAHRREIVEGTDEFAGLAGWMKWLEGRTYKMHVRVLLSRYRSYDECTACGGSRLKEEARWWKLGGKSISDFYALSIDEARAFLAPLAPQFAAARTFFESFGWTVADHDSLEADDLLGTFARLESKAGGHANGAWGGWRTGSRRRRRGERRGSLRALPLRRGAL